MGQGHNFLFGFFFRRGRVLCGFRPDGIHPFVMKVRGHGRNFPGHLFQHSVQFRISLQVFFHICLIHDRDLLSFLWTFPGGESSLSSERISFSRAFALLTLLLTVPSDTPSAFAASS